MLTSTNQQTVRSTLCAFHVHYVCITLNPGLQIILIAMGRLESVVVAQDGVCQACQRSFTAGHASKKLTLKGRPYKQLWQYGFR